MKISNSKKELARIISENGGWREGANWISQDRDGGVYSFSGGRPVRHKDMWCLKSSSEKIGWKFAHAGTIPNWHQTILSREEYFHLYPAPDADGWIEWKGGECPVGDDALVEIKTLDGEIQIDQAYYWNWSHERDSPVQDRQIIAYRLHNQDQVEPEFCESVMRSIPEHSDKPTIEQLAAEYRSAKDYAERKQEEADAAKADAEAKLADLIAAGKALGLVLSVAAPEPELVITDWRDLRPGDEITCIGEEWIESFEGRDAVVMEIETKDYEGYHCIMASMNGIRDWGGDFKFIRRP